MSVPNKSHSEKYFYPSQYQTVTRDLSFLVDKKQSLGQFIYHIKVTNPTLIKNINIFDIFEGSEIPQNKKAFAITYDIQAHDRTLSEKEINNIQAKIIKMMKQDHKAELRI